MNPHRSYLRTVLSSALVLGAIGSTACSVHAGWQKHKGPVGPVDLGTYLHYKLGIHDFLYGDSWPTYTYTYKFGSWGPSLNIMVAGVPGRAAPRRTARFDDLNLSVNVPGGHWVKLDPKQTGSRACFLMSRRNPTIVVSLAVEPVGIEVNDTNSSVLAVSQAKMKSLPEGIVIPGERQLTTHGIQGVAYEASAVAEDGTTVHYSIWVAAHNGYNYSLAVYGEQKHKSAINNAMRSFVRGIRQIKPKKVARTDAKPNVTKRDLDPPRQILVKERAAGG